MMNRIFFLLTTLPFSPLAVLQAADAPRPNVLMIIADDLNDWVGCLQGHQNDPNEWTNLAAKPELASVKVDLAKWFPQRDVAPLKGKKKGKTKGSGL